MYRSEPEVPLTLMPDGSSIPITPLLRAATVGAGKAICSLICTSVNAGSTGSRTPVPGHRLSPSCVYRAAANLMPFIGRAHLTFWTKCVPQRGQLLLPRPTATAQHSANDVNPTTHMGSRCTAC